MPPSQRERIKRIAETLREKAPAGNEELSAEDEEIVSNCLQELESLSLEYVIKTKLNKVVLKYKRRVRLADTLLGKWRREHRAKEETENTNKSNQLRAKGRQAAPGNTSNPECTGLAAEALQAYQKRHEELKRENKPNPDMQACRDLRPQYRRLWQNHGEIEGVPIGLVVEGRGEASILGIHSQITKGIESRKHQPCFAVCLSGDYDDKVTADGTIYYTGSGGRDKKHNLVKDQEENADNTSLIMSIHTRTPVRVLRRKKTASGSSRDVSPLFVYAGLYRCVDYTYKSSDVGPKVYEFTLVPIKGKSIPHRPASWPVNRREEDTAAQAPKQQRSAES